MLPRLVAVLLALLPVLHHDALAGEPRTPRDELATFRLAPGFRAELVAAEPDVVDPVALTFDERGRLIVCEMRGYPNAGVATGEIASGRIRILEDRDGDGYFERASVFADGLRFPTSAMPWKNGLIVAQAPDILYLEDADGDGRAERRRVLYSGFGLSNIQQIVNGLQWGIDNWVHGSAGSIGGDIVSGETQAPPVPLRGRGIRFRPSVPASLEPASGGGQFGLAPDAWGRWFVATNSQHLRHIVLPDHYLRRNVGLSVPAVTLDIADHGAACRVHRLSPFEEWRVERTTRRAGSADAKRFPANELVPGGFITSGTSPVVYVADLFPEAYRGNTFVCDPANNLIHRDRLEPKGATFTARRTEDDHEFFASTDNWCRPVWLTVGPDGALYVADFYREVIETPLSLPDDIKQRLNLESRGRGRIWRIVPESKAEAVRLFWRNPPAVHTASAADRVRHLAHPNLWWRLTAQRLLVERGDRSATAALREVASTAPLAEGRAHALWTLDGLQTLDAAQVARALRDPSEGVREQALRLADERLTDPAVRAAVIALADDPVPRVRFQAAFTLGQSDAPEAAAALARIARRDLADPWTILAVLSSAGQSAPALLEALVDDPEFVKLTGSAPLLTKLAATAGARGGDGEVARVLERFARPGDDVGGWRTALLEGLGQGLQNSARPLNRLWDDPPPALRPAVGRARSLFEAAAATAVHEKKSATERLAAVRLLGHAPFATAGPALRGLLSPREAADVQLAAVRALSQHAAPTVAELLLEPWPTYGPAARREVVEALFSRADRLAPLLAAVERKAVPANGLEPARVEQLRRHPNATIRDRAARLFAGASDRQQVVSAYRSALELTADPARGKLVFGKTCATCHRLENVGQEVGPDLLSALRNKSREQLLNDLLDPSREVDPRYVNYVVTTKAGRQFTGLIAAETATGLTLRRAERAEDTVLRGQIEEIAATAKSVMPEGLEAQLGKQDVADVIAYLQQFAGR